MRIAVLCHYFAPEPGAPQARLLEMSRTWIREGHQVTVLTGFPNHPTGLLAPCDRGRLYRLEEMEGLRIHRSWLYSTPNRGILRKTMSHLSFMVSSVLIGGARAPRPDVLVVSSPTFFSVLSAWVLSLRWGVPFVFEVRDLWPAIFTELGVLTNRKAIAALEGMEMFLYRRAARVVTVTEGFRQNIVGRGIAGEKVVTITNGVDTGRFQPGGDRQAAKRELGLEGKYVVLYLGAHGISHALDRILEVASRCRDPETQFLFVGDGAKKHELVRRAEEKGLENVRFLDPVPKDRVALFYQAADVGLVPLRNVPLFRTFIPSKMFEIMATGTPVVASLAGEAEEILGRSGGALVVGPEDVDGIVEALTRLRKEPGLSAGLGRAGTAFVRRHYDRSDLARQYLSVLADACGKGRL